MEGISINDILFNQHVTTKENDIKLLTWEKDYNRIWYKHFNHISNEQREWAIKLKYTTYLILGSVDNDGLTEDDTEGLYEGIVEGLFVGNKLGNPDGVFEGIFESEGS